MDELTPIKNAIDNHCKRFPNHRRYPKEIWRQIIALAPKYNSAVLAKELGIDRNNLTKKIRIFKNSNYYK